MLVDGDQEDHGAFELLLDFQQVRDQFPVAVDIDSKFLVSEVVYLVAGVLIEEGVGVTDVLALG